MQRLLFMLAPVLALAACAGEEPGGGGTPEPMVPGLVTGTLSYAPVYEAVTFRSGGETREWIPMDVTPATNGTLWVVQRAERTPGFDDEDECTTLGLQGLRPQDCAGLFGSTVELRQPQLDLPASEGNGRAELIKDANDWHFMRRPAGIAFGAPEISLPPDDPGAEGARLREAAIFRDTFATCHEHFTGNPTDQPPFIGPTLWTADEDIYDGVNGTERFGTFPWSNGDHLDMVHGTGYCVGIAWERDNVYWLFNGELGVLDRYDFGMPHLPGADYHLDATIDRYEWPGDDLVRVPNVPSNLAMDGAMLYLADSGNGRILAVDTSAELPVVANFTTPDPVQGDVYENPPTTELASRETLEAEWGGTAEPSGLAVIDANTLVVANHASGHLTILDRNDGAVLRTVDTGLGEGLGGLTVFEGAVYFVHIGERRVYRVDVTM